MTSCYLLVLDSAEGGTLPVAAFSSLAAAGACKSARLARPEVAETMRLLNASYRIVSVPMDRS